jgi:hypothetical protein
MEVPNVSGAPNRIRQLGQLPSSQPDFGTPHSGHISESLTMPSFTISISFFSNLGGMLQLDWSGRVR